MLNTYSDFLDRVNQLGFFPMGDNFVKGLPNLQRETLEGQWHTGQEETDPWRWKDRAARERQLAFGCILGGYKGFISRRLYPLFYEACRPEQSLDERYDGGNIPTLEKQLYRLFQPKAELSTAEIRKTLQVTQKNGASQVDAAVQALQADFLITVCGNRRKVSQDGKEYGWPANTYCRVEDWAVDGWLDGVEALHPIPAREQILDLGAGMAAGVDRALLARRLFGRQSGT